MTSATRWRRRLPDSATSQEAGSPTLKRSLGRVDLTAMAKGLIVYSTMPTRDGFAGDQTLFAPPLTTADSELSEMVRRFAETVRAVARSVEGELS